MSVFNYAIDHRSLPPLWRVQHSRSATDWRHGGLQARGERYNDDEIDRQSRRLLMEHFDWASPVDSPFISVFANERHARRWAGAASRQYGGMTCMLYHIDPTLLERAIIFDATRLVRELKVPLPRYVRSGTEDELLILHAIPAQAISLVTEIVDRDVHRLAAAQQYPTPPLSSPMLDLPFHGQSNFEGVASEEIPVEDVCNTPMSQEMNDLANRLVERLTSGAGTQNTVAGNADNMGGASGNFLGAIASKLMQTAGYGSQP